ncbi:hypothetical protein FRC11_007603, partial [Ceratobasidium sp. 423]
MLPGITAEQFRNYLFAITSRPGDEDFSTLADRKREYWDDRLQRVCTLYVDIATLARMFGTTKLEVWAIHALHFMFTDHHETLTRSVSRIWGTDTILRLRTLSRNTELERPVASFIQYFITINLEDMTSPVCENDSRNARACMDLYDIVKKPDVDPVLLGCIFLKVLSLGHRSWIWLERMTRKDRPILYAAQVQFVNASSEIQNLEWLRPYPVCRELVEEYWCDTCESKVMATWNRLFGKLGRDLGSGLPLKDVLLLSQVAINRWRFYEECTNELENCCGRGGLSFLALPDGLLNYLDDNIQKLYEEVASRYRVLA